MYKLAQNGTVLFGVKSIPPDPQNSDYRDYLAWLAIGNIPDPADPFFVVDLGVVGNTSPIIAADGIDFVVVYLIGDSNSSQEVLLNGEPFEVLLDEFGYGEFELSSDTPGLLLVEWGGFSLELAAL